MKQFISGFCMYMRKFTSAKLVLKVLLTSLVFVKMAAAAKTAEAQNSTIDLQTIYVEGSSETDVVSSGDDDNSGVGAEQRVQSTASSSTLVSRRKIEDAGITSIEEAVQTAPNFQFSNIGSPRLTYQSVRGIGASISTNYFNNPIGVYVDGVPVSGAEFNRSVGDAQSIEILRGPQGTMSGHNALAGAIYITTRVPTGEPSAEFSTTLGNNGQRGGSAMVSGPLAGKSLTGRAFFEFRKRDGFTDYAATGETIDDLDAYTGSGSLRFAPNQQFQAILSASVEHIDEGGYAYQLFDSYKNRVVDMDPPNGDVLDSHSATANLKYKFGSAELMSLSSYREYDVLSNQNLSYNLAVAALGGGSYTSDEGGKQYSQELRLSGDLKDRFTWFIGALYLNETHNYEYDFYVPAFGPSFQIASDYERKELAGYGEGTLKLLDGIELTGGVRVVRDRHDFVSNQAGVNEESFTIVTPKFRAAYRFDADRLAYISATRGARAGGFDRLSSSTTPYDTEYLWSYETGLKSQWLDRSITFNASAYHIDWTDQQVHEQVAGITQTLNAGKSHSQGLELDGSWRPIDGLEVSGFLGITFGEYDQFIDAQTKADYSGNKLINTPEVSGGAAVQYKWPLLNMPLKGVARLEYHYKGDHYFDFENRLEQESYSIFNARLGVEDKNFNATLFVKNLFDTDYRIFGFNDNFGPGLSQDVAVAGPSRLIGVELKARF